MEVRLGAKIFFSCLQGNVGLGKIWKHFTKEEK